MRKRSSHKSVLMHFHDDGEVCPQSFGQTCPHGGIDGPMEPASPSFLSKLPNGFNFNQFNGFGGGGGMGGMPGAGGPDFSFTDYSSSYSSYDTGGGSYGGVDSYLNNPSSTSSNYFDASGFMSDLTASLDMGEELDVAPNSLVIADANSQKNNQAIANMAKMAISSGTPSAVAAMAKMAAASGNAAAAKAMTQMAQMAASSGVKAIPPQALMAIMAKTGLGGAVGMTAAMAATRQVEAANKDNVEKQIEAQKYAAVMQKQAANVQMSKTIANSSLAKMSDQEIKKMTEGQFSTTKEFLDYMQSPDTEVKSLCVITIGSRSAAGSSSQLSSAWCSSVNIEQGAIRWKLGQNLLDQISKVHNLGQILATLASIFVNIPITRPNPSQCTALKQHFNSENA